MHGMINEAMRRHVSESAGDDAWERILARADTPRSFAALHDDGAAVTRALRDAGRDRPSDVRHVGLEG